MNRHIIHAAVLLLLFLTWNDTHAQSFRLGVGAMPAPYTLNVEVLGREKTKSRNDRFDLEIAAEADVSTNLTVGVGFRSRSGRYFTRQVDMSGLDVGWGNTLWSTDPYYQLGFSATDGYEIPLSIRYRLSQSAMTPYLCGEYSVAVLESESVAFRYRQEGWDSQVTELHTALAPNTVTSMTLGAGVETRVNSWFSFLMDVGWKHTFTTYLDEDFMRVREADTMAGRLMLMFEIFDAWN